MSEYCMYCYKDLPRNKNAIYRSKGLEFCHPNCKAKFLEEEKEEKTMKLITSRDITEEFKSLRKILEFDKVPAFVMNNINVCEKNLKGKLRNLKGSGKK